MMKPFTATGPLELVSMNLLVPFKETARRNAFTIAITDWHTRMKSCTMLWNTTAATAAAPFLKNWVYASGAPQYIVTDSGKQLVVKFLDSVSGIICSKHYLLIRCHQQTNGQAERSSGTIVQRLRHYVADHQLDWYQYLQSLAHSYNVSVPEIEGERSIVKHRINRWTSVRDMEAHEWLALKYGKNNLHLRSTMK